jgi:PLP dependent protein
MSADPMTVNPALVAEIRARVRAVRERITTAARASGRDPAEIRLVAVTKTHPVEVVHAAVAAGLTDLGENRVQELQEKRAAAPSATWHLVGRLQRNKVRHVVDGHVLIHSLDRVELADEIQARAARAGVVQPVLVQVNVGDDPAKGGCAVHRTGELVAYAQRLPNLLVTGLMTVPPLPPPGSDPPHSAAVHFARLRALRDEIRGTVPTVTELSMGMSADLESAVAEGATMVRVGTDLFGTRGEPAHRGTKETG